MPPATFANSAAATLLEAHERRISSLESDFGEVQKQQAEQAVEFNHLSTFIEESLKGEMKVVKELVEKGFTGTNTSLTALSTRISSLEAIRVAEIEKVQKRRGRVLAVLTALGGVFVTKFGESIWDWFKTLLGPR